MGGEAGVESLPVLRPPPRADTELRLSTEAVGLGLSALRLARCLPIANCTRCAAHLQAAEEEASVQCR